MSMKYEWLTKKKKYKNSLANLQFIRYKIFKNEK